MGNEGSSQSEVKIEPLPNTLNVKWTLEHTENDVCCSRDGHTACSVNSRVYMFGGVLGSSSTPFPMESNELFEYNCDLQKWRKIEAKGIIPKPRSGATMTSVQNKLYLFGGLSQDIGWFNDLNIFDMETETWSNVTAIDCTAPSPRDKLTSVAIDNTIYFFGGFGPQESSPDSQDEEWNVIDDEETERQGPSANFGWFDNVFTFDTNLHKWEDVTPIKLHAPSPRAAHTMCSVGDQIIIFGGRDSEARRNDIYILNTTDMKWLPVHAKGSPPAVRSFHAMTAVDKRAVIIGGRSQNNEHFNDCHIFDTETSEWLQPTCQGILPEPRGCHTITSAGASVVLYGGSSEFDAETRQCQKYHGDVYVIKTDDILTGAAAVPQEEEKLNLSDNIKHESSPDSPAKIIEPITSIPSIDNCLPIAQ